MTRDQERCIASADELIEAARDKRRPPRLIEHSYIMDVFHPIACRLYEKGVSAGTIVATMRACAQSFEWAAAMDAEGSRRRYAMAHPDAGGEEDPVINADKVRAALIDQLRRMERTLQDVVHEPQLSEACETVRTEIAALEESGAIDRAEAVVSLARLVCDTYELPGVLPTVLGFERYRPSSQS